MLTRCASGRTLWPMGGGYWHLGKIGGVPIRIHWSLVLGLLFFSGMRFAPGFWLGFVIVILVHELGHALIVKITRQRVHGVTIHGMGGECQWSGNATPIERACIAWGGVWAQLALFLVALPFTGLLVSALGNTGFQLARALTWNSLILVAINLIPFGPLDGAEAWKLPGLLVEKWRRRRRSPKRAERAVAKGPFAKSPKTEEPSPEIRSLMEKIARDAREARRKAN